MSFVLGHLRIQEPVSSSVGASFSLEAVLLGVQVYTELPARVPYRMLLPWTALSPQSGHCKSWRPWGEASLCL